MWFKKFVTWLSGLFTGNRNGIKSLTGNLLSGNTANSLVNKVTGAGLTGAEQEANQFTAEQAQINRDWQEQMDNTKYQRTVADMKAAGINPALAMSNGVGSTPSGSAGSSVSPGSGSLSDIIQLMMLKPQKELLEAQAAEARATGEAALKNADTAAGRLGVDTERLRTVDQPLAANQIKIGDSLVTLNDARAAKVNKELDLVIEDIELAKLREIATSLDIAWKGETWEDSKRLLASQICKATADAAYAYAMSNKADKEMRALAMDNDWKAVYYKYWSDPKNADRGVNIEMLRGTNLAGAGIAYIQAFGDNLDESESPQELGRSFAGKRSKYGGSR